MCNQNRVCISPICLWRLTKVCGWKFKKYRNQTIFLINLWKGCLVTMNLTEDSSFSIVLIFFFLIKGAACLACWLGCLKNRIEIIISVKSHITYCLYCFSSCAICLFDKFASNIMFCIQFVEAALKTGHQRRFLDSLKINPGKIRRPMLNLNSHIINHPFH